MRKGFTLVELSIVLVIIGLLIGGILVARSMIETARIQSFIREIQQFDVATSNFRTKFKGLPGDSSIMGCINYGGNTCDDGLIVASGGFCGGCSGFDGEIGAFWPELQAGGFSYPGKTFIAYTDAATSTPFDFTSNTPYLPLIKASIDMGVVAIQCRWVVPGNPSTTTAHCWTLMKNAGDGTGYMRGLTPAAALAIDTKMDDGQPYSGDIQNYPNSADDPFAYDPLCDDGAGAYAVINNDAPHCYMQIHMLKDEDGPAQ